MFFFNSKSHFYSLFFLFQLSHGKNCTWLKIFEAFSAGLNPKLWRVIHSIYCVSPSIFAMGREPFLSPGCIVGNIVWLWPLHSCMVPIGVQPAWEQGRKLSIIFVFWNKSLNDIWVFLQIVYSCRLLVFVKIYMYKLCYFYFCFGGYFFIWPIIMMYRYLF